MEKSLKRSFKPTPQTVSTDTSGTEIRVQPMNILGDAGSFFLKFLSLVAVFLAPIHSVMFAVGFLILADLVSGIIASHKRNQKITSNGFRRTIIKMLVYQGTVVTAFICQTSLLPDLPLIKVVGAMIALTELKSFFENVQAITGVNFYEAVLEKLHGNEIVPPKKPTKKKGK